MNPILDNNVARPIKYVTRWIECTNRSCRDGMVPDPSDNNLENDREVACPDCDSAGGHYEEVAE